MGMFRDNLAPDWRAQVAKMLPVTAAQLDALGRLIVADRLMDDQGAETPELIAWVASVVKRGAE